jgi:hypothetical protein
MIFQTKKGALQQFVVQYNVAGALDFGTTAPSAANAPTNEESVHELTVLGNVGVIDPDLLGGRSTRGDRFMVMLRIDAAVAFPLGFRVSIVDATGSVPSLGEVEELRRISPANLVGQTVFTTTECVTIAQGKALAIGGLPPPPAGQFHRITIEVRAAVSGDDEARLASMCCCQVEVTAGGAPTPGPEPGPSREYYTFSSTALSAPIGAQDFYFQFGALLDVATFGASGANSNVSNSILNFSEGAASISAEKLSIRAGSVTGLVMRLTGVVPPLDSVQPFVEVAVGGGGFVRTYTAPAQAMGPNNNLDFAVAAVDFPVNARIRAGYTVTSLTIVDHTMQAELEITTPA